MDITSVTGKKVAGTIEWPTLNKAMTKFHGSVEGDSFKFEEYEAIKGEDEVQIPSNYDGTLINQGKTLKGKIVTDADDTESDTDDQPTFQLDIIEAIDDSSEKLKQGSKLTGTCYIQHPFVLKITKRKGTTVEGTIKWQEQKCKTKFKGKIENDTLTFEEHEVLKKQDEAVTVPMFYTGKMDVSNGAIDGTYGPAVNKLHGTFKIKI